MGFQNSLQVIFLISLLKCSLGSIAFIVSWLVPIISHFSTLKKEMSFASHGKENTCSVMVEAGRSILHNLSSSQLLHYIRHEYLHILLNIYLFIYLIYFGDGDREIIEA